MSLPEIDKRNTLLNKLENKELTYEQFEHECYLWTLEPYIWNDIRLLQYPEPPKDWVEYENLGVLQKAKITESFFNQLVIKEYLQHKSRVYSNNYGHYDWLKKMKAHFPMVDENKEIIWKIDEKLDLFHAWFSKTNATIEKARQVFNAQEY